MDIEQTSQKIQIAAVRWQNGVQETVVMKLGEMGKLLLFTPDVARALAFALVEAADYIDTPEYLEGMMPDEL